MTTEIKWIGNQRVTTYILNNQVLKTRIEEKQPDGSLELIFEEFREYWSNGKLRCIWNSEGDLIDFDKEGNPID